jgi:hypothetical protein
MSSARIAMVQVFYGLSRKGSQNLPQVRQQWLQNSCKNYLP